ncbi:MAG: hypothetical protein U0Q16_13640 [Bryobacteraceae bacterium]
MKTVLRIGFSALAIVAIALGRDSRAKQEPNEKAEAAAKREIIDTRTPAKNEAPSKESSKRDAGETRVVRLGGDSDEGTLISRNFKTIILPRIKAGRCASVDAGISIRSGDRVALYVDEGRDAVVWALQENPDGGVGIQVCNHDKQDQASEPWPVMLFVRR